MSEMKDEAARLEREIAAFVSEVARRRHGRRAETGRLDISLSLEAGDDGGWTIASPGLLEPVEAALDDAHAAASPLQDARVFCHRCESAACPHSVPDRPAAVFAGYGQTGRPEWHDLSQVLLDLSHEGVERLHDRPPRIVAAAVPGRRLKTRQLAAFGRASKSYDVLGQVVAGYFPLRVAGSTERVAITAQAVEHRGGPRRRVRLTLNVIARTTTGDDAAALLLDGGGDRLRRPLEKAREALRRLEKRLDDDAVLRDRREQGRLLGRVPGILRDLARDLESGQRRARRRTAHAEQRRRESRPVPAAVRESRDAPPSRTFVDEREDTLVVLGRRNRAHVFAPDGRLVTSLALERGAVERRLRTERWRRATDDEAADLRRRLAEDA